MATRKGAAGSGTIRQRKDGRWEARYSIGINPATGKHQQKSIYGKTQREVRQKLNKITHSLDSNTYLAPNRTTVAQWLDEWTETYLGGVKASTVDQYCYQCRVHLKPSIGAVRLQELSAPMIQKMYNNKIQSGLSPKSVRNINGVLHAALKQALVLGLVHTNPCDAVKLPRVEKKEINPLDADMISKFMKQIQGHKHEYFYLTDLFTGLRQGELIGLTWDCVDFDRNTITVYRQLRRSRTAGKGYSFSSLKNDKERTITVAPFVMDILRKEQRKQRECRLLAGSLWQNPEQLVFTNEFGGHLTATSTYEDFKLICRKIGIPNTRFHDLRHTFATLSLANGDDVKTVQENLGHATPSFTLSVYAHATQTMKQASAERMQNFIENVR